MTVGQIYKLYNYIMSNIILSNQYSAEGQFRDTSFSRKSLSQIVILPNAFFRIVIQPNGIFPNRRLAEHHFPKNALSGTNATIQSKRGCDFYCYWYGTFLWSFK